MTQEEFNKHESIPNRRYYVLMEDTPCWHWSRNEDNTFDWTIIGYNQKAVSPIKEIPEEDFKKSSDDYAIEFALFLSENMYENMYNDINKDGKTWVSYLQDGFHEHTQAERFTIQEILEIFKKEKKL